METSLSQEVSVPVLSPVQCTLTVPHRADDLTPPAQGQLYPHTIATDLLQENTAVTY